MDWGSQDDHRIIVIKAVQNDSIEVDALMEVQIVQHEHHRLAFGKRLFYPLCETTKVYMEDGLAVPPYDMVIHPKEACAETEIRRILTYGSED